MPNSQMAFVRNYLESSVVGYKSRTIGDRRMKFGTDVDPKVPTRYVQNVGRFKITAMQGCKTEVMSDKFNVAYMEYVLK